MFDDEQHAPEQMALRDEESRQLCEHVSRLTEVQQQVLHLRFATGLRATEIAQRLNKSDAAVRALLSRALNVLRDIYEQ